MTRPSLKRVLQMSPREIAGRTSMTVRQQVDRWSWDLQRPRWRRARVAAELDPSVPDIGRAARLLSDGDEAGAHRLLSAHFASRPPRFVLVPHSREAVARLVRARFPAATADACRRADRALDGTLDVLGHQDVCFGPGSEDEPIDWLRDPIHHRRAPLAHWSRVRYLDPALGDHKVIW